MISAIPKNKALNNVFWIKKDGISKISNSKTENKKNNQRTIDQLVEKSIKNYVSGKTIIIWSIQSDK